MKKPEGYYDDLAAWAESDAPSVRPDAKVLRGEAARAASRALLEAATEDDPAGRQMVRSATKGRPTLDPKRPAGKSPLLQVRVPQSLDDDMRALAAAQGRTLSEVTRDALTEYLAAHRVS